MRARVVLAALSLLAFALLALPVASAAPADPVCVPPDGFQLWVCDGTWGSYDCVMARVGPPVHGACVDPSKPGVIVCLFDDCIPVV